MPWSNKPSSKPQTPSFLATQGTAEKFRIYLHLDTTGQGWLTKRGALPPHLLRTWTCEGLVQPVWETGGSPVNVGRTQRIVPDRTRRLVQDRDRGCAYPGCLTLHHLECHHPPPKHLTDQPSTPNHPNASNHRDTSDPPTKSCTWTGSASTADHSTE